LHRTNESVIDVFVRTGWLPPRGRTGYVPSECAGALLLRRAEPQDNPPIVQLADGIAYRNRNEAPESARECLGQFPAGMGVNRRMFGFAFGRGMT